MNNPLNTKFVRDRTLAILIWVISLFVLYFAWYVSGHITWWKFVGVYLIFRGFQFLFDVAYYCWKGLNVDLS